MKSNDASGFSTPITAASSGGTAAQRTDSAGKVRKRRGIAMSIVSAFWDRVDTSGGLDACWPWTGGHSKNGYGAHTVGVRPDRRQYKTHRFAYEDRNGTIPPGLLVCHRCDNPPCCNPAHLFLGTHADNHADKARKGRAPRKRGETNPASKLTAAQATIIRESGETCKALRDRFGVSAKDAGVSW